MKLLPGISLALALIAVVEVFAQTPVLRSGFPVGGIDVNSPGWGRNGPTLADVTGDGMLEIVSNSADAVYVIRHDGMILTGWPQRVPFPYSLNYSPAVGDIDGDGVNEIVVLARDAYLSGDSLCLLYAWQANGAPVTGFPIGFGASAHAPVLYDLDEDRIPEIIQIFIQGGHYCSGLPARCYVIKGDGSLLRGWPQTIGPKTGTVKPAVGDIDGDGHPEIVTALGTCYDTTPPKKPWIYAWHSNGSLVQGFPREYGTDPLPIDLNPLIEPALLPVGVDGTRKIAFGAYFIQFMPMWFDSIVVWVIDHHGNVVPNWPQPAPEGFAPSAPLVVYRSPENASVHIAANFTFDAYVWHEDGQLVSSWYPNFRGGIDKITPAELDTASSGLEFAMGTAYLVNSVGYFVCTYLGGQQLLWSPLLTWGDAGYQQAAFGDLDNDGSVEMVVMSRNTDVQPWRGYIWCWTFPGLGFTRGRFPWPMHGHDRWHTSQSGFVPDSIIAGAQHRVEYPGRFDLKQNYPNPFNSSTRIVYDLARRSFIRLAVSNVLGQVVAQLHEGIQEGGNYSFTFDALDLPSGVYFCTLEAKEITGQHQALRAVRKMVLMR